MTDTFERLKAALADRYAIERELGSGSMGTVHLATDCRSKASVALKVLNLTPTEAVAGNRFLREIAISAELEHPHIVPVLDSGEAGEFTFYVMPYLEAPSLRERLTRERRLPLEEAVGVIRDVATALDFAHARGIMHRDIKPENILFSEGLPLLSDFGIAVCMTVALDERLTQPGETLGTPTYMSPEQAMGRRQLTWSSDVYSLGCVLYEMLAGEPPFIPARPGAIIVRRYDQEPPLVRQVRDEVPKHLERALVKALAWLPEKRFETVGKFLEALE